MSVWLLEPLTSNLMKAETINQLVCQMSVSDVVTDGMFTCEATLGRFCCAPFSGFFDLVFTHFNKYLCFKRFRNKHF